MFRTLLILMVRILLVTELACPSQSLVLTTSAIRQPGGGRDIWGRPGPGVFDGAGFRLYWAEDEACLREEAEVANRVGAGLLRIRIDLERTTNPSS